MAKPHPELIGDRCDKCNGSGNVPVDAGGFHIQATCDKCRGTGLINSPNACTKCKGSGNVLAHIDGINTKATCGHCNGSGLEPIAE